MRVWTLIIGALSLLVAGCINGNTTDALPVVTEGERLGTVRFFDESADESVVSVTWPTFNDLDQLAEFSDVAFVGSIDGVVNDHMIDEGTALDPSGVSVIHDGIVFGVDQVIYTSDQMSEIGDRITISQPVLMTGPRVGIIEDGRPLQEAAIRQEPIDYLRKGLEAIEAAERPTYLIFARMGVYGDHDVLLFSGAAGIQQIVDGVIVSNGIGPFNGSGWLQGSGSGLTVEFVEIWLSDGPPPGFVPGEGRPIDAGDVVSGGSRGRRVG